MRRFAGVQRREQIAGAVADFAAVPRGLADAVKRRSLRAQNSLGCFQGSSRRSVRRLRAAGEVREKWKRPTEYRSTLDARDAVCYNVLTMFKTEHNLMFVHTDKERTMRTLIGFRRVVFAAVAAMGVSAQGGEQVADQLAPMWFVKSPLPVDNARGWGGVDSNGEWFNLMDGTLNDFLFNHGFGDYAVLDMGCLKKVTRLRTGTSRPNDGTFVTGDRGKNVQFSLSSNLTDWVQVYTTGTTGYPSTDFFDIDLSAYEGKYRYAKVWANNTQGVGELQLYTTDMTLTLDPAVTYDGAMGLGASESSLGVRVSGAIGRLTAGMVTVDAYAAQVDLGDDVSAWEKGGRKFTLFSGEAAAGTTKYSGYLTGLGSDYYFVRTFASCEGEGCVSAPRTIPFVSKSKPAPTVKAYVTDKDAKRGCIWVNGKTDESVGSSTDAWVVFDLKAISDAGCFVSAVRMWYSDSNSPARFKQSHFAFAYDDNDEADWGEPEVLIDEEGRQVSYVSALPSSLTWELPSSPDAYREASVNVSKKGDVFEFPVRSNVLQSIRDTYRKDKRLPRYLRFTTYRLNVAEIELRVSKVQRTGLIISVQ